MTAEYVAQQVLQAVAGKERECVLAPLHHRITVYLRVLCPALLDWILRSRTNPAT